MFLHLWTNPCRSLKSISNQFRFLESESVRTFYGKLVSYRTKLSQTWWPSKVSFSTWCYRSCRKITDELLEPVSQIRFQIINVNKYMFSALCLPKKSRAVSEIDPSAQILGTLMSSRFISDAVLVLYKKEELGHTWSVSTQNCPNWCLGILLLSILLQQHV